MALIDDLKTDMEIFYDSKEFAIIANYKGNEISLLKHEDYDFETFTGVVYTVLVSQMSAPKDGDEIIIDSQVFYIQNFSLKDETKLEYIIGLIENE